MTTIDPESLNRFLPLMLDVNRLCGHAGGEEFIRALSRLAATSPNAFERLTPELLGRVQHARRQVRGSTPTPLPRLRRRRRQS